ncbi:MAG TPA: NADH-quinone oxidoreductase subunit J [Dehalococcoidia bacterium]|nr:NADH-quinone oxidoreductase subunit J [Dehalococcoidia bacterium]
MEQVVFYILAALAVAGGLGVVLSQNVARAALSLILTLAMVAAIFLLLAAEFLALVQILIYGGAVTILLLFALMLTRARELPRAGFGAQWPFAIVGAGGLLAVIVMMVADTDWHAPDEPTAIGFEEFGDTLFRVWSVPFEIASLVLLVALVGAILLAGRDEEES